LDFVQQVGNGGKNVSSAEESFSMLHELSDRVFAIADEFLELGGNQRDGLGFVEFDASGEAFLG